MQDDKLKLLINIKEIIMWIKSTFFKYSIGLILILLIIFLLGQVSFFIEPFKNFLAIIITPLLISMLLYYLMRPLVRLAKKLRFPKALAILAVFLIVIAIFALIGTYAGSLLSTQLSLLIKDVPQIAKQITDKLVELMNNQNIAALYSSKIEGQLTTYVQNAIPMVSGGLINAITAISSTTAVILVVPFMLFFFLKDDEMFYKKILNIMPQKYKEEIEGIFIETDKTLSAYILGQAFIALITGVLSYIGFLIIGLNFSFILALFVFITAFIPILGTIIGVIPAILVGVSINPFMGIKILIIMIVVQQLAGGLIAPNIFGKSLDIHPLTITILFLGAASLYGITGMLIAVPAYAVCKVVFSGAIKIYKIWKSNSVFINKNNSKIIN